MLHLSNISKPSKINLRSRNNQFVFAILMICLQIIITIIYSIFVTIPRQPININSILTTIFFSFLVIIGFGLFFGQLKNLVWSGIGFALLMTAFSIQVYPLINALWAKANIHTSGLFSDNFNNQNITLYLATLDSKQYENNTIPATIKCALALIVAFGSVIGRVGPLQCLIMSVVGIIGYELNRSININIGQDFFGTFSIFTFGGFLGITFGIFMTIREKNNRIKTFGNSQLVGSQLSTISSLIGIFFIFILFPFLAYEGDQSFQTSVFHRYITPVSILLSMGSSMISSIAIAMLINGDNSKCIRIKHLLNSIVAGGIATGAASFYITTPYLALISGAVAGILQYFFDNWLQNSIYKKIGLVSTHSFTLFCFQGFIGAIFAAAYNGRVTSLNYTNDYKFISNLSDYGKQFVIYFISSGFGVACGLIVGIPCSFLNKYRNMDLFHDKTEFKPDDGISYKIQNSVPSLIVPIETVKLKADPSIPKDEENPDSNIEHQKLPENLPDSHVSVEYSEDEFSFDFAGMFQVAIQ